MSLLPTTMATHPPNRVLLPTTMAVPRMTKQAVRPLEDRGSVWSFHQVCKDVARLSGWIRWPTSYAISTASAQLPIPGILGSENN